MLRPSRKRMRLSACCITRRMVVSCAQPGRNIALAKSRGCARVHFSDSHMRLGTPAFRSTSGADIMRISDDPFG